MKSTHDGHGQIARAIRQCRQRAVSEPVREHSAASGTSAESNHHSELRGAARRAQWSRDDFRLHRGLGSHGESAPGDPGRGRGERVAIAAASPWARSSLQREAIACAMEAGAAAGRGGARRTKTRRTKAGCAAVPRARIVRGRTPNRAMTPARTREPIANIHPAAVATTLLMVAILIVAPSPTAAALVRVARSRLPTIQVETFIRARVRRSSRRRSRRLWRSSWANAGPEPDVVDEFGRRFGDHPAVFLALAIDVAEQQVQARSAAAEPAAADLPAPPIYAKVNPADAPVLILGITSKVMPSRRWRISRHAHCTENLPNQRRRSRQHQRRPAAAVR